MDIKFSNNASSYLVDPVSSTDTEITIAPGTGYNFPTLLYETDFFMITVSDTDNNMEIMKVLRTNGDIFTVERGKENTFARDFTINSTVENRLTAGSLEYVLNDTLATPTKEGRVRLATPEDVADGISTDVAVTPASLESVYLMRGIIVPFSGSFDDSGYPIDSRTGKSRLDWHICDGTKNTPDLRGRFILAASADKPQGSIGGSATVTVNSNVTIGETTLTEEQMPAHGYHGTCGPMAIATHDNNWCVLNGRGSKGGSKAHTHTLKQEASTTNIFPPYYSLSYIMKL